MKQTIKNSDFIKEEWMTNCEVQELFKISKSTLYRWCNKKELPYIIMGGTRYYPKHVIKNYMARKLASQVLYTKKKAP